jgi:mannose PTS system EIID component
MTDFPPPIRWRVLARSLAVQGSFDYESLIGTGFAFTLVPMLRTVYRDDPQALSAALARHAELFNSHPYFVTVAAGAVARLEAERADREIVARFKTAVRGSLGSVGDQVVWRLWRPATAVAAIALLAAGVPWWIAVTTFLVLYNLLHLYIRVWGLRTGLEAGLDVARRLREAPFARWAGRAAYVSAFLVGFATLAVWRPTLEANFEYLIVLTALPLGLWLGNRVRAVVGAAFALLWLLGLIYGATIV